jgi:hypothetical protein
MRNTALATVLFISLLVIVWLALDQQVEALLWLVLDIGWLLAALFLWNKTGPIDRPRLKLRLSRLLLFWS